MQKTLYKTLIVGAIALVTHGWGAAGYGIKKDPGDFRAVEVRGWWAWGEKGGAFVRPAPRQNAEGLVVCGDWLDPADYDRSLRSRLHEMEVAMERANGPRKAALVFETLKFIGVKELEVVYTYLPNIARLIRNKEVPGVKDTRENVAKWFGDLAERVHRDNREPGAIAERWGWPVLLEIERVGDIIRGLKPREFLGENWGPRMEKW